MLRETEVARGGFPHDQHLSGELRELCRNDLPHREGTSSAGVLGRSGSDWRDTARKPGWLESSELGERGGRGRPEVESLGRKPQDFYSEMEKS